MRRYVPFLALTLFAGCLGAPCRHCSAAEPAKCANPLCCCDGGCKCSPCDCGAKAAKPVLSADGKSRWVGVYVNGVWQRDEWAPVGQAAPAAPPVAYQPRFPVMNAMFGGCPGGRCSGGR